LKKGWTCSKGDGWEVIKATQLKERPVKNRILPVSGFWIKAVAISMDEVPDLNSPGKMASPKNEINIWLRGFPLRSGGIVVTSNLTGRFKNC